MPEPDPERLDHLEDTLKEAHRVVDGHDTPHDDEQEPIGPIEGDDEDDAADAPPPG